MSDRDHRSQNSGDLADDAGRLFASRELKQLSDEERQLRTARKAIAAYLTQLDARPMRSRRGTAELTEPPDKSSVVIERISVGLRAPAEKESAESTKRAIDQTIVQHALWSLINDGTVELGDAFVVRCARPRSNVRSAIADGATLVETDAGRDARMRITPRRADDHRSEAQRDRDRLLYAPAFRRLAGVTQVVGLGEVQLFHNRLTHSLKVAQVARMIAERLCAGEAYVEFAAANGPIDPHCVEVAALAHDLGHPPFGHVAEDRLQTVLKSVCPNLDSFEGNAQSFRIVTKLAVRGDGARGLNLTSASLRACTKYPWRRSDDKTKKAHKKWGAYGSEHAELRFAVGDGEIEKASVEAEIMDWADDIAYAVHDIEDFFRAGLIPLDRIANERDVGRDFARMAAERLVDDTHKQMSLTKAHRFWEGRKGEPYGGFAQSGLIPLEPFSGSLRDQSLLQAFASGLTTRYVNAVGLDHGGLKIDDRFRYEVEMLKQLTRYFVIDDPALAAAQEGQCRIIEELFMKLWTRATGAKSLTDARLPTLLHGFLLVAHRDPPDVYGSAAELVARAVVDYIASLTEQQAVSLHQRLTGASSASALDAWLRG